MKRLLRLLLLVGSLVAAGSILYACPFFGPTTTTAVRGT